MSNERSGRIFDDELGRREDERRRRDEGWDDEEDDETGAGEEFSTSVFARFVLAFVCVLISVVVVFIISMTKINSHEEMC